MERRHHLRIDFEDKWIHSKKNTKWCFFPKSQKLKNISRGGLCVNFDERVNPGEQYLIKIASFEDKSIFLKAQVVWTQKHESFTQAGLEFLPFSSLKDHNSITALKQLQKFILQCEDSAKNNPVLLP